MQTCFIKWLPSVFLMLTFILPFAEAADGPAARVSYTYYADTTTDHRNGDLATATIEYPNVAPPAPAQQYQLRRYDAAGRLIEFSDPRGGIAFLTYTPRGMLAALRYDRNDRPTQVIAYSYDATAQLSDVTFPNGLVVTYKYDPAHRLAQIGDSEGNVIRLSYADNGADIPTEVVGDAVNIRRRDAATHDPYGVVIGLYDAPAVLASSHSSFNSDLSRDPSRPSFLDPLGSPIFFDYEHLVVPLNASGGGSAVGGALALCARTAGVIGLLMTPSSTSACDTVLDRPPQCFDRCDELLLEIHRVMNEIEKRIEELLTDRCDFYHQAYSQPNPALGPTCPGSWRGHIEQAQGRQNQLQGLIERARKWNCPIPPGAWALATRPLPTAPRGWYPNGSGS